MVAHKNMPLNDREVVLHLFGKEKENLMLPTFQSSLVL